jgi:hypothetical protein
LQLTRRDWTSVEVRRVVTAYPFMTAKVIGAIHWEALKLWFKRVPVFTHQTKVTGEQKNLEAIASAGVTKGNFSG